MKPILISSIVVSAVGLLAACQEQKHAVAPAPRPVLSVVVTPQAGRIAGFAGTVEPRYKSDHGFRVLGRIVSRDVNVGDVVRKDQRLATLDPVAYQLAVRSAQSDLASATARLENASATETRQRTLLEQKIANQAQFDAARQARETAEAGVTRARADLDKAVEQLGYTELRADFDGVITAAEVELGEVVQPGQTVVTVARPDIREAVIDLPENVGQGLRPGARFEIALQLDPSVRAAGTVREIAPQADPATRTRRMRITLDAPPESFRLGTTITATAVTQAPADIELPSSALLEQDGRTMVWTVDPATGTVSTQEVTVAARDGSSIRIQDGIAPGMRVVTAGVHSLTPNQPVKIADEALP
ncbi:efflux RND transporter periplasmic adaptor subunit [Microvirga lotononidis]|uniref:RND family efflux transporter, MFP subunit n=1 Tax=Microvirga lotononidis TaxID=864069 RepID=I4YZQ1_9HYPH|nr:efflux RND transporter periplasmic adaptor subunit [Microvirga lotononidis]EIM29443.1 RND family efflux transporter, MFP subunit [Microvirga lotononidis]WQO27237.1 efflux RND transporter periplasmic adaptor subunit [Microvirga lotononidis]